MSHKIYLLLTVIGLCLASCKDEYKDLKNGLYAKIETSKGDIMVELFYQKTPVTVANFITLAEGKNKFVSDEFKGKPFYAGLKFHRVISKANGDHEDFMIQTGDPLGNGSGDAGYKFSDEFTDLRHDQPGVLSMANSGPNTNSSQFFITLVATPWLDLKHTVFGRVVGSGQPIVGSIVQDDQMKKITIIRKGKQAEQFDAVKIVDGYFKKQIETQKINEAKYKLVKEQKISYFEQIKKSAIKTPSGFAFTILQKTAQPKPKEGETVYVEYAGFLEDGTLFDTSSPEIAKQFGTFDEQRALQQGYSALPYVMGSNQMIPGFLEGLGKLKLGEKAVFFIPPQLGYGERGAGNVIPPNANLIFEVELKNK